MGIIALYIDTGICWHPCVFYNSSLKKHLPEQIRNLIFLIRDFRMECSSLRFYGVDETPNIDVHTTIVVTHFCLTQVYFLIKRNIQLIKNPLHNDVKN